ncbi:MAG: PAS domain S-box protein, partial [Spirochaetes bacterium]|nr:PAS domain S-box protein [Spirochaetota bacterium]
IHYIMIRFVPLGDGDRGLMLLDDVTNRKIVERSLLASERRYRALYDSMLDGFVSLDMEGNILEFNSAYRQMTGYSSSELRRMTVWDLTPERWHDMQRAIMKRDVLRRGHSDIFEKEYRRRDGTLIPVELRIQLIRDEEGTNRGTWSIVHDITERKKSEEELLKTCKIESLGVFAGGIAHDFNNLLTAIHGNISIAKMEAQPGSDTRRSLDEAEHAAMRARDLTMQLLTFSRGGAPIKKLCSIRELLVDTSEFVLSGSGIRSEFSISDELWSAELDEGQISQVIHNLVLNAREAMPEGGVIFIHARNRSVVPDEFPHLDAGNYIEFRIADTGGGIPEKDMHKIFDPFFTTKDKGNGLGLSVTYSIIKRHNGFITVDSSPKDGTVFTVILPAAKDPPPQRDRPIAFPILRHGRVLVMDDEEMVLHVATRIIDRLGLTATTARNGSEAIELYRRGLDAGEPFDLVIMDLTVPGGMGGREAITLLKQIDPSVRAIVSSGYSNDPVMASFRDFGFLGVVAKPYSIEDLRDAIQRVWK